MAVVVIVVSVSSRHWNYWLSAYGRLFPGLPAQTAHVTQSQQSYALAYAITI